jgi:hypothetical protein
LQDFCTIVGNENKAISMAHQRSIFRNVFTEAVGSLGQCADPSAPLITKGTACLALPSDVCGDSSGTDGETDETDGETDERYGGSAAAAAPEMFLALLIAFMAMF